MNTIKQTVENMVRNLPDDCSIEDIQYHLYVLEKIRRGLESSERHGVLTHQQAKERLKKWIIK